MPVQAGRETARHDVTAALARHLPGSAPDRRSVAHGRTCPNFPPCRHGLVLHDIPEAPVRRDVCTVQDCGCGRST